MDVLDLISSIDNKILTVRTKSLEFSFNELADMYKEGELIIDPEFQRLFRWSETLQSQFIESIILELPLPPIFVVEREDRVWELIDGLQRMSSWLHFRGLLKGKNGKMEFPLVLRDCDIVEGLNGLTFETLPQSIKTKIKRSPIRVEIIGKDSSPRLKYDMFNRLNTNGLTLSSQEIRNATIRLLEGGDKFMKFLIELSGSKDFKKCIESVSDYDIRRKADQELVLRFFSLKNWQNAYGDADGQLADFMTRYAEKVAESKVIFEYDEERSIFLRTFEALGHILGADIFVSNKIKHKRKGQYRAFYFEAFSLGIQGRLKDIREEHYPLLKKQFTELKENETFNEVTSTKYGDKPNELRKRIEMVSEIVELVLK